MLYSNSDPVETLVDRTPSLFFTPGDFRQIRVRLARIAHELKDYSSVDDLYDEILDSCVVTGWERRIRPARSSSAPAWACFISDDDQSVRLGKICST